MNKMDSTSLIDFIALHIEPHAQVLNDDSSAMEKAMGQFFEYARANREDRGNRLTFDENELLYKSSTAFAFTLAQHLAAYDRISEALEWQKANADTWSKIQAGQRLCGSASTHLAKPGASTLTAQRESNGYLINGSIPWCTGFKIFDMVVIGFDTDDELIFALNDFPKVERSENFEITPLALAVIPGSSSAQVTISDLKIHDSQIVGRRKKDSTNPPGPRKSPLFGTEIGVAARP